MITVGIVEDNDIAKTMLERLVDATKEFECIFACGSGEDALEAVRLTVPDVMLVDVHLPGLSGVELARRVKERCPDSKIIMLTADEGSETIVSALEAGACGYLLKSSSGDEIVRGIKAVYNGGVPLTREVARKMVDAFRKNMLGVRPA